VRRAQGADALIESKRHVQMDGSGGAGKRLSARAPKRAVPGRSLDESSVAHAPMQLRAPGRMRPAAVYQSGLSVAFGLRRAASVGRAGVGKTTTLAKIATRAVLGLGRNGRVISLNIFRVGSAERWRRHAELTGSPVEGATGSGTCRRVAHEHTEDILMIIHDAVVGQVVDAIFPEQA